MKNKVVFISIAVLLIAMAITNPSKKSFLNQINNSRGIHDEFYLPRMFKNKKNIHKGQGRHFISVFELNYHNYIFFSYAELNYGWGGTINPNGKKIDFEHNELKNTYILLFKTHFELSEEKSY